MKISDETLDEFIRLYKEEFKEKIRREEAYDQFSRLISFLRLLYFPEAPCSSNEDLQTPHPNEKF